MTTDYTPLKRHELRAIFKRNRGAARRLSEQLGLAETSISHWLKNKTIKSANIEAGAQAYARKLLEQEKEIASHAA